MHLKPVGSLIRNSPQLHTHFVLRRDGSHDVRRILTCKAADVCDCRRTARPVLCAETPLPLPRAVPLVPPGARVLDPVRKEAVKCVGELCKQQLALCLRDANGEVLDCTGVPRAVDEGVDEGMDGGRRELHWEGVTRKRKRSWKWMAPPV